MCKLGVALRKLEKGGGLIYCFRKECKMFVPS
nr:MAG TPA: hypothetical protein [Bacteriophage sp.]